MLYVLEPPSGFLLDAHTRERNPRGRNRSRTLCALEMYPERCRKAPARPQTVLPPGPAAQPTAASGTRPTRGQRSWRGAARRAGDPGRRRLPWPGSLCPHASVPGAGPLLPGPRRLPAPRLLPGGGRAGGAVTRAARRGRRTWRRGARAGAQLRKRRARDPRPPQVLPRGASAASSRPAGAGRGARLGGSAAQLRGQPGRPPWFRSIVGRLTQSAATRPRLAPSPPGAPRPRGSLAGGVGGAERARPEGLSGEGMALPGPRCP